MDKEKTYVTIKRGRRSSSSSGLTALQENNETSHRRKGEKNNASSIQAELSELGSPLKATKKEAVVEFPGKQLIAALWMQMTERGETTKDLAVHLGIAYPYLMALARGERPVPGVDRGVLVKAANYLSVPVVSAYIMAEALDPTDFVNHSTMDQRIRDAISQMQRHPDWCGHAPSKATWAALHKNVKLFICMLFEKATGTEIFDYATIDEESLAATHTH